MSELVRRLEPTLRRQQALVTIRQVLAAGGSREAVRRLVSRGIWAQHERGVYGPTGLPVTWERQLMAYVLAAGPGSVASHRAAGRLLGAPRYEKADHELTIPRLQSFRRPGLLVHESSDLHLARIIRVGGIPCTDRARLAVDLGAVERPFAVDDTIRHLRFADRLPWEALVAAYLRHRARGRRGCGALHRHLDRYDGIAGVPESTLELIALDMIIDAGLPIPVLQHPIGRFRVDFAYVAPRIVIEIDGRHHREPPVAAADRRRDRLLRAAGWIVIRISGDQLLADPGLLCRLVSDALRQRAA